MKIQSLYSRPEDDPKERKNPNAVRPSPSPSGLAMLASGGGGSASSSGSSGITVGTTAIASGTTTKVLYNNAGVVGEYTITGTGNVVMSASPTLTGTAVIASQTNSGTIVQTSASATAFVSGPNGATNPIFTLVNSTASSATGISITGAAAGSGVTLAVTSSGSNESLFLTPKGTGQIILPLGSAAAPMFAPSTSLTSGIFWTTGTNLSIAVTGSELFRFGSGGTFSSSAGVSLGPSASSPDAVLVRSAAGVIGMRSSLAGAAAQVTIGTSTDTADAQLSVYSQSTTRPSLKLRSLSGTSATQEVFQSYDSGGTLTLAIRDNGHAQFPVWRVSTSDGAIATSVASSTSVQTANFSAEAGSGRFHWTFPSTVQAIAALALGGTHNAPNLYLYPDAANILAQRNSTNAQTFRVYNTYTDASNYERNTINWSSNVCYQRNQNAGTGTARLYVPVTGAVTVANLPAAATAGIGARAFVTDGSTTVILGLGLTVAGGGANNVPVYSDGTNWIVG